MSLHWFTQFDHVQRLSDGVPGYVVESGALYAHIRTEGTFPETVEVEQGDPGWYRAKQPLAAPVPVPPKARTGVLATTIGRMLKR
jgi:hypothetical protein